MLSLLLLPLPAAGDWERLHQLDARRLLRPHAAGGRHGCAAGAAAAAASAGAAAVLLLLPRCCCHTCLLCPCPAATLATTPPAPACLPAAAGEGVIAAYYGIRGWPMMLASKDRGAFLQKVHAIKVGGGARFFFATAACDHITSPAAPICLLTQPNLSPPALPAHRIPSSPAPPAHPIPSCPALRCPALPRGRSGSCVR